MLIIPSRTPRRRLAPAATSTPLPGDSTQGGDGCRQSRQVRGPCRDLGNGGEERKCMKSKKTKTSKIRCRTETGGRGTSEGGTKHKNLYGHHDGHDEARRDGARYKTKSSQTHSKRRVWE
eukprot:TRINITY_DN56_c0_g1_i1.p3 TRINITY_DN56_c0_g1~~TRINITY_DN56_c0_g1_i1.p3  ORF type:complete len:120 (+),score=0.30 TRINITY_DN56_c0_g1_i1:816-1175(+)